MQNCSENKWGGCESALAPFCEVITLSIEMTLYPNLVNSFLFTVRTCWKYLTMIEEIEHVKLRVHHFKQVKYWKWHFRRLWLNNWATHRQLHIKLCGLVDPLITHTLGKNMSFYILLYTVVDKNCKITLNSNIDVVINHQIWRKCTKTFSMILKCLDI